MPASHPLASVVERRAAALARHLPDALAGDLAGVHQARVASRRLRETLPLVAAGGGTRSAGRALRAVRRVTRALGPVRELDVALDVLTGHLEAHADEVVEGLVVRAWLERLRADRREAMLEALGARRLEQLRDAVARVGVEVATIDAPRARDVLRALGERIDRRADALAGVVAQTGVLYAPDPLHAVRIATKKLRYAVELVAELQPRRMPPGLLRTLKRRQELLGRIHDLEVLCGFADRACAEAPRRVHAARLVGDWQRECRELHASYVRTRQALLQATTEARRLGRRLVRAAGAVPPPGVGSLPR